MLRRSSQPACALRPCCCVANLLSPSMAVVVERASSSGQQGACSAGTTSSMCAAPLLQCTLEPTLLPALHPASRLQQAEEECQGEHSAQPQTAEDQQQQQPQQQPCAGDSSAQGRGLQGKPESREEGRACQQQQRRRERRAAAESSSGTQHRRPSCSSCEAAAAPSSPLAGRWATTPPRRDHAARGGSGSGAPRGAPKPQRCRSSTAGALLGVLLGALVSAARGADLSSASSSMQQAAAAAGAAGAAQQGGGSSNTMVPRVAIVSEKAFHLEVLAGFISILQPDYGRHMVVYMHQMNFENRHLDFGFGEFLQGEFDTMRIRALPWLGIPTFDVVVFLSPEYRVDFVKNFLDRCGAKLAIMMVHNGDARDVPLLLPLHPNAHLMTLSPHVQKFVQQRLNTSLIDWMLPLKALTPRLNCAPTNLTKCLAGFAIQGAMDSRRRNYTNIFHQLDTLINSSSTLRSDQRLRINVVGSGRPEKLGVPPHLEGRVLPHTNLRFQDFYELIHTNLALLPALASDSYYDRKFSSTLITSLVTGVPVVVDRRFLDSYTFLSDSHVVRQLRNDTLTEALQRMLGSSNEELLAVRRGVAQLRAELSKQALAKVKALLQPLLPSIQKEWERSPW